MKFGTIITLALLFCSSTEAIRVKQHSSPKNHGLISIEIDAVNYVPERV